MAKKSGAPFFPPKDEDQQAERWELAGRPSGLVPSKGRKRAPYSEFTKTPKKGPVPKSRPDIMQEGQASAFPGGLPPPTGFDKESYKKGGMVGRDYAKGKR